MGVAAAAFPLARSAPMLFTSAATEAMISGETSTYVIGHLAVLTNNPPLRLGRAMDLMMLSLFGRSLSGLSKLSVTTARHPWRVAGCAHRWVRRSR
ncbi:hypothetical protein AWC15_13775 [Mycobacterium lacus]|nr:hypothetical protein AWC15_13775 [Mycobacterium lacus]